MCPDSVESAMRSHDPKQLGGAKVRTFSGANAPEFELTLALSIRENGADLEQQEHEDCR